MEAKSTCCSATEVCGPQNECNCKAGEGWSCEIVKMAPEQLQAKHNKPFYVCKEGSCCCTVVESGAQTETKGVQQPVSASEAFCYCEEGYACTFTKKAGDEAGKTVFECGNGCKCEIDGDSVKVVYTQ